MNLETIADILVDAGLGTKGTNLFVHRMPADKMGILLRELSPGSRIDPYIPNWRKSTLMLIVRSPVYSTGYTLASEAQLALTIEREGQYGNMFLKYLRPENEPFAFPHQSGDYTEFLVSIDACWVNV